jgi:3-isopropylmalate/(R)-2-methylmalate dehydratase large subunit
VAKGVTALVTPGSFNTKAQAEKEGLGDIFTEAGFFWGTAGCSLCGSSTPDHKVGVRERSISATNRNMVGRQGPSARTHLASPEMVAAAAITGRITDIRDF